MNQYRYEPGHLYVLDGGAYVHCYSCNPSLSREKAIERYENEAGRTPRCCPILEQTADGVIVGRCWTALDGFVCTRHGSVEAECEYFRASGGKCTLENKMRERKNMPLLGGG